MNLSSAGHPPARCSSCPAPSSGTPSERRRRARRGALLLALCLAAASATTGCSAGTSAASASSPPPTSAPATPAAVTLTDGWVKATGAGEAMTAMFGTLANPRDEPVTVTGASSPVAGTVELHQTVRNASGGTQMQPKAGGLVVPARGSLRLEPGGDHVMLLGLREQLPAGATAAVTLSTSAGPVSLTAPVRSFPGAKESYMPSASP